MIPGPGAAGVARALAHDLRGMLHNVRMALELAAEQMPPGAGGVAPHLLDVAQEELARADRVVHHVAVLVRLQAGDPPWRQASDPCDLVRAVGVAFGLPTAMGQMPAVGLTPAPGRGQWPLKLPPGPLPVAVDEQAAALALAALRDGLAGCTPRREAVAVSLGADGVLDLRGPDRWAPVLAAVQAALPGVPPPEAAPVPYRILVHLAVAAMAAAACGVRQAGPEAEAGGCRLQWHWPV